MIHRDARKSRSRFAQWLFKADDSGHTAAGFYTNRTVVRAYQDFRDEPRFTRVVPIEEIRAKEGQPEHPAIRRRGNAGANRCRH